MLQQVETYGTEVTRFIAQISIVPLKKFNIYYLENYAFQFEQGELISFCHIYDEKDNLLNEVAENERHLLVVDFKEVEGVPHGNFPVVLAKVG